MYPRLFTFGCSFTSYWWPTWADLLLSQIDGQNWGLSGVGNKCIFESLIECDLVNQITSEDKIIIMWSGFTREDRYMNNHWMGFGNVYNAEPQYDKAFLTKYWDDKGCILHNLNFICAAIKLLEAKGCDWTMASMVPLSTLENLQDITEDMSSFKQHLSFIEQFKVKWIRQDLCSFFQESDCLKFTWDGPKIKKLFKATPFFDNHPTPLVHYNWLKKHFDPSVLPPESLVKEYEEQVNALSQLEDMHPMVGQRKQITSCIFKPANRI